MFRPGAPLIAGLVFRNLVSRVHNDTILYISISLYTTIVLCVAWLIGDFSLLSHSLYFEQWVTVFLVTMPLMAIAFDLFMLVHRFNRRRALAFKRAFSPKRLSALLGGMALLGGLMFFQGSFTSVKNMLPILRGGFTDDVIQADIDKWIHLGVDPWVWLHSIAAHEWALSAIEFNYNVIWFILCFGALFFVATSPRADGFRKRYMLMFAFVWIFCGNILAGLFLSAGPAFYGYVVGDHERFAGLLGVLARSETASSAARFQAYLWQLHQSGEAGFGSGISAFPSIHVGLIMLNALFLKEYSRRLGFLAFVYVGLIQFSSVYLGWHYAIDGYVSIVVVTVSYLAAGRIGVFFSAKPAKVQGLLPVPLARASS